MTSFRRQCSPYQQSLSLLHLLLQSIQIYPWYLESYFQSLRLQGCSKDFFRVTQIRVNYTQKCCFGILEKQELTPLQISVFLEHFCLHLKYSENCHLSQGCKFESIGRNVEDQLHMLQIWRKFVSNHYIYLTFAYQYLSSKYMYLPTF